MAAQIPLLSDTDTVGGAVDYRGHPVLRSSSGGWRSARFIIGVEVAERFAYYGISSNLITYLTGPLGQSVAAAAENANIWSGLSMLLTLLGAFLADSFFGRYRTIVFASALYVLGLGLITLSASLSTATSGCQNSTATCSTPQLEKVFFFVSLYLVAVGQGGHKPCVQAFGADQFDGEDPEECRAKSSFFNWWYFGLCGGSFVTISVVIYIQENLSWSLGFGIPCAAMVIAFLVFVLGTKTYRYSITQHGKNPFLRIGRVFVAAIRNWRTPPPSPIKIEDSGNTTVSSQQFKFLNKACYVPNDLNHGRTACTNDEVEEAKAILRIIPIWITTLVFAVVFAQTGTFFTKQGATIDRSVMSGFTVPAASLQSVNLLVCVVFVSIYDLLFVPVVRALTRNPVGITKLQRIGVGMVLSAGSMVIAALVEIKRLKIARQHGLIDLPEITIPMSFWWLIPQYVLLGVANVFTVVGLQEFFYEEVPKDLKSMGLALYGSLFGVGSLVSSFLVSVIDKATQIDGQDSWFANNLNKAHLDYFYFLLGGLNLFGFLGFLYSSKSYIYSSRSATN
ncbi:protein NRT1/ PTR FAMILY 5.10-like isoform X1 [Momordica charantia]|uniref:Protein NRT1/ PTR FAMILY 5.10-like isoform X1 n=1 Tax=Momordica charantia TaxID=3673 RepID=A0A6J1DNU3_MOMCH|nr:protein NRT1/ PTR FAMILY 5.10-like isoform X1 [Momordica charantia]